MQPDFRAVVTGDVNASSKLPAEDARRLEAILQQCFRDLTASLADAEAGGFTTFRGDAWQFFAAQPVLAVRATLFFRSALLVRGDQELGRRIHTAVSIGFGRIKYLPSESSSAGGGQAYELSGKRLDRLRRRVPGMGISGLGPWDPFLDCSLGLIDALAHHWTALQARAVSFALQGLKQSEIAVRWHPPISQQAVHKHLRSAGWPAIDPALQWMETTLKGCIYQNNLPGPSSGVDHAD